jgi:phenylacetate-CoA ligase
MNLRGHMLFAYQRLRGYKTPQYYREYVRSDSRGLLDLRDTLVSDLLRHCREMVPHYAEILRELPDPDGDPLAVLRRMPILTKQTIRERFDLLKSRDLASRRWFVNTSGGSTGEPARFIQDNEYAWRTSALALAFGRWVGHETGDTEVDLWGDEREVVRGTLSVRDRLTNRFKNRTLLNAFRMTPDAMRGFAETLRTNRPKLILAYAQALYEFSGFVESERLEVPPVNAIITSAGTLHPFMRQRIERVFRSPVYNRYGSREVGLIAAERPGVVGLWVAPWNVLLEVVDEAGRPVPAGKDGEILVTSLVNLAMPLVRYRIGDRGALGPGLERGGQVLTHLLGRNVDAFRRRDGTVVDGEYFTHMIYFRDWVEKFQFVQRGYDEVILRIVSRSVDKRSLQPEMDQMAEQTKAALGPSAMLKFEWVDEIPSAASGKYRYTVSELPPP